MKKALYGLKQLFQLLYKCFTEFFSIKLGFHWLYRTFVHLQDIQKPIITTFVNDLNIFALTKSGIKKQIKEKLCIAFNIIDIEPLAFYINLKVTCDCK